MTVCTAGALIVLAPLISLSLSSFFSLMVLSRSASCLLHSSWARCTSVLALLLMISRASVLMAIEGWARYGNVSLNGGRSSSFGGGVGGFARAITGSGLNGLNGGEENDELSMLDVG